MIAISVRINESERCVHAPVLSKPPISTQCKSQRWKLVVGFKIKCTGAGHIEAQVVQPGNVSYLRRNPEIEFFCVDQVKVHREPNIERGERVLLNSRTAGMLKINVHVGVADCQIKPYELAVPALDIKPDTQRVAIDIQLYGTEGRILKSGGVVFHATTDCATPPLPVQPPYSVCAGAFKYKLLTSEDWLIIDHVTLDNEAIHKII